MAEARDYKLRTHVRAEKLEKDKSVGTANGVQTGYAGDYLVHVPGYGTKLVKGNAFEAEYVPVGDEEKVVAEFTPKGKTVDVVLEFLSANPGERERVLQEERDGASRKGILES